MIYWELFAAFFKIGLFTIGGGYAMLALIQQEILAYGWMTSQEFVDIVGIAEMTPGPIAINAATFIGYRTAGVPGSLLATLAVVLPSFLAVLIVSRFWEKYKQSPRVQAVFSGIRPTVAGLVGAAVVILGWAALHAVIPDTIDWRTALIALAVFGAIHFWKRHPISVLVACGILGLFVFAV